MNSKPENSTSETERRVEQSRTVTAPTTTAEENRHTASQRRVNMVWEYTQSVIALLVTSATLYTAVKQVESNPAAALLLSNAFFLVIGFYFGRTNHTNVGGVQPPHEGR